MIFKKNKWRVFRTFNLWWKHKKSSDVEKVLNLGFEKISINSLLLDNFTMVDKIVREFGTSTINFSVNVKKNFFGNYKIYDYRNKKKSRIQFY